tara:strand:- start:986 stop:1222 length:237 start_codon:yes stop_codon:yes gene_type:complete
MDKKDLDKKVKGLIRSIGNRTSFSTSEPASMGPNKSLEVEKKLKEYQLKKFGKCFSCGEPIQPMNCHFQCTKCGYAEN